MKHRTLRLYCPSNAFVCLFFPTGNRFAWCSHNFKFFFFVCSRNTYLPNRSTSGTPLCQNRKQNCVNSSCCTFAVLVSIPLRNGDGNEDVRKCAYLMKTKKNNKDFCVRCMTHSYIFSFWRVFVWRFSFDVPYETTFILEWRPRCCRYRLCVRSLVSNFLPESSSLKCKLAASENVFFLT